MIKTVQKKLTDVDKWQEPFVEIQELIQVLYKESNFATRIEYFFSSFIKAPLFPEGLKTYDNLFALSF